MNWMYGRDSPDPLRLRYTYCASLQYGEWITWKLSCFVMPMLVGLFMVVPPPPALPPRLTLPVLSRILAEEWWSVIPDPFYHDVLKAQNPMEEHMVRAPLHPHQVAWLYNQTIFLTVIEVVQPPPALPPWLTLPVQVGSWAEEWWSVIPDPFYHDVLKAQNPMEEHMVRAPLHPHQVTWLYNQTIFLTVIEVKDNINLMDENMKWRDWKVECRWDEIGETGEPWENFRKSRHFPPYYPLGTPRFELGTQVGTNERSNSSHAGTANELKLGIEFYMGAATLTMHCRENNFQKTLTV